jgi:ribosome production factor 1
VVRRRIEANAKSKLKSLQTKKLREELGEEEVPKGKNDTIESMRVKDETLMDDKEDEDIVGEQSIDEFAKYFNRETTPKIVVTTNRRPKGAIFDFLKELKISLPNCEYYPRENFRIKDIIEWSKERNFTDIMVF